VSAPGANAVFIDSGSKAGLPSFYAGSGKLVYRWTKDGVTIKGATKSTYPLGGASWASSGIYTVEVTDTADRMTAHQTYYVRVALPHGHLVAFGDNEYGQCEVPAALLPPRRIHAIASGGAHNVVISEGIVTAWGDNSSGQCTVPAWGSLKAYDVAAGAAHSLALLSDGSVRAWGDNTSGQCTVPTGLGPVCAIAAGAAHSLALLQNGTVVGWGDNSSGQLNIPSFASPVVALAAGHDHSLALLQNGTAVAWGANDRGQISIPSGLRTLVSIGAAGDASFAINCAGHVYAWGDPSFAQTPSPAKLKPVSLAAGGWDFIAARLNSGSLAFWGAEAAAMTTEAKGVGKIYALAAGGAHVLALRDGASDAKPRIITQPSAPLTTAWDQPVELSVVATGALLSYQWYFNDNPIPGATQATYRIAGMRVDDVGSYTAHVFNGASEANSLTVTLGSPGLPGFTVWRATSGRQVAAPSTAFRIELGGTGAGSLSYTWRHNGVLIPDAHGAVLERVVTGEDDGGYYIADVLDAGGRTAQLATLVVVPPVQPIQIVAWGDNALGQTTVPDGVHDAIALAAGTAHTLALRANGTVVAWGDDRAGQTDIPAGLNDVMAISAWGDTSAALRADGTIVAWGRNQQPLTLATGSSEYTRISVAPNGVYATGGPQLDYVTGMPGADTLFTYTLNANGNLTGVQNGMPPRLAFVTNAAKSKSVISSSSVIIIIGPGGGGYIPVNPGWSLDIYSHNDGAVYFDYASDLRAFSHYNGASAALGRDKTASFWFTRQEKDFDDNLVWRSLPINPPATFDKVEAVAAGENFFAFIREAGGAAGLGPNSRVFARSPFRLTGVRSIEAGANHVVALLEADAPPSPRVVQAPASRAVAAGESVRLTVRAEGRNLRYQWFHNDAPIPGASDFALDLGDFDATKSGSYFVRVSDGFTTLSTTPAILSQGTAPVLTQRPTKRAGLRVGERLELTAVLENSDAVVFQWLRDGVELEGETRPVLIREAVALADAGRYTLKVTGADGACVRTTSHVFVLPVEGTRIIRQSDGLYPLNPPGKWQDIEDAVDFLPAGLALRLDGRVYAWEHGIVLNSETKAWIAGLSDIVAISNQVMLRADGRLEISPYANVSPEAADLTDVIALIPGAWPAVVTQDGRVGVLSQNGDPIRWLPSVGEYVTAQNIWLGFMDTKAVTSYGSADTALIALGADGTTVSYNQDGRLGFEAIATVRRLLPDADGGASVIDAQGGIHPASSYGRLRIADDTLANVRQAEMNPFSRVELSNDGAVHAWTFTAWNADQKTEVPALAFWRRGNLRVHLDDGQVMVLRSAADLPSATFAKQRFVFDESEPIVLDAATAGLAPLTFTWERNGAALSNVTGPRLELPAGNPRNAGWYRLRVTNADGVSRDEVVYVQIHAPGARLVAFDTYTPNLPELADVVDMGPGIAIRADGTVARWNENTGEITGVVPENLGEVVAVTTDGSIYAALNASGVMTSWDRSTGAIICRLEGVLWLRDKFAIMRNGTVFSLSGTGVHGWESWHREVVDVRSGQVLRATVRFLVRRDGSVAYYDENRPDQPAQISTRGEFGGTIFDLRVNLGTGIGFLVEKPDGQVSLIKASLPGANQGFNVLANNMAIYGGFPHAILSEELSSLSAFDRNMRGEYAITSTGDLVSSTGKVILSGVLRVWSQWALVKTPAP